MRKKLLSIILSLAMVLTMIPAMGSVAYAATEISTLNLTYDPAVLDLNTAWTEGEVSTRAKENMAVATTGATKDYNNSSLCYFNTDTNDWYGISRANKVLASREYGLRYHVSLDDGYDWVESAKKTNSSEISGLTVRANGVDVTGSCKLDYLSSTNSFFIYFSIGYPSTDKIVTNVSIDDGDFSLEKGGTHSFTGSVEGTVDDKSIQWIVQNATSASTTITSDGKLKIGIDETASKLKVIARSVADSTKEASVNVTVLEAAPYISSVSISPSTTTLHPGDVKLFEVSVEGTQTDKSVTWSITGQSSANTKINDAGVLEVGYDETASSITVKAVANRDSTKYDTATVTIEQFEQVSDLEISYDAEEMDLNTGSTEGQADTRLRPTISTSTTGIKVDSGNSGLNYYNAERDEVYGIDDGSKKVSKEKTYWIKCSFDLESGYDWIASAKKTNPSEISGLTVKVNGTDVTSDCRFSYSSSWNIMVVYFPIGKAKECVDHEYESAVTTPATMSSDGEITYTCKKCGATKTEVIRAIAECYLGGTYHQYTGKTIKPFVWADDGVDEISIGKYFDVTRPAKCVNVGAYKVIVNFKDKYSGTVTLTYKVVPAVSSIKSLTPGKKKMTVKMTTKPSSKGASTYQIYYKQKGTSTWKKTTTTSYYKTIKSLKKGKQYYVKVRAYKKVGTETYYGAWSKTKLSKKIK